MPDHGLGVCWLAFCAGEEAAPTGQGTHADGPARLSSRSALTRPPSEPRPLVLRI
jgi:hypothetical protein